MLMASRPSIHYFGGEGLMRCCCGRDFKGAGPATASVQHGNHAGQSTGHIWERRFCDGVPAPFRFTG